MKLISPRLNPPLNSALDLGFEDGDFLRHGKRSVDGFSFGIRAKKCLDSIDAALIDEHIFPAACGCHTTSHLSVSV